MEQTFTFDDILIKPKAFSELKTRSQADTSAHLFNTKLEMPIISASMSAFDTMEPNSRQISWQFADEMSKLGGLHIFSRSTLFEERYNAVQSLSASGNNTGIAVSIKEFDVYRERLEELEGFVSIDIANGAVLSDITWDGKYPLIVGNFGNPGAVLRNDLRGNLIYKLGIGSGASCSTRIKTGIGAPQAWLINKVSPISSMVNKPIISDGGIKSTADFVKALGLGADAVMMGYMFAAAEESPWPPIKINEKWYKPFRGMASGVEKGVDSHIEGVSGYVPYEEKPLARIVTELKEALTSAMSYSNSFTLNSFKAHADFILAPSSKLENNARLINE